MATTALLPLAARATAQSQIFELVGSNGGDRLGHAVAAAGDVNGDGYDDVIIGIPQEDTSGAAAGAARVVSGSDGVLLYRLLGEAPGDAFGTSVAGAGDFDGDGLCDVIVGAPGSDAGGANAGRAVVFSGATGAPLYTLTGSTTSDLLGTSVAGAGDVNGDGYGDVIVGAPQGPVPAVGPGYAVVCSGRDRSTLFVLTGDALGDTFGASVSGAGDLDQDCRADVVVGAPLDDFGVPSAGSAKVFAGSDGGLMYSFHGLRANDFCGHAVAGGGDVDGDGIPDVAIGSPGSDMSAPDAGTVQVFAGVDGVLLHTFAGMARGDRFGWAVDCQGDVDGDGFADVVAGSPFRDTFAIDAGAATVHSGRDGRRLCSLDGRRFGDRCGFDVAFAGNVNRDGRVDVIVGCPLEDSTAPDAGTARVFAGLPCRHTPGATIEPPPGTTTAGTAFGRRLAALGDLDGDGTTDFIVGAPGDSTLGRQGNGSARVLSGADQRELFAFDGDADGDGFGSAVGSAGDVNGDGINDPIVGAPDAGAGAGMVRVFSGSDAAVLHTILGGAGDGLGAAVDRVGDLDVDGRDDFMAGAPRASGTQGEVRIYAGDDARLLWAVAGATPGQQLGTAARSIGDLDGDGLDDLALGGPAAGPTPVGPGVVRVVSGINGTLLRSHTGAALGDAYGSAIAPAGDVNGDGVPDLLIGAPLGDKTGTDAGYAHLISGASGRLLRELRGAAPNDRLGSAVAGIGEANGDGVPDYVVGAPGVDRPDGQDLGAVLVVSGRIFTAAAQAFVGDRTGDGLGNACIGLGDINGDGRADFAAGAADADRAVPDSGLVRIITSLPASDPGLLESFGPACVTSQGTLPRGILRGRSVVGHTVVPHLWAAPPGTLVTLLIDGPAASLPLASLGAPGCLLLALPNVVPPSLLTDAMGKASLPLPVPAMATLIGGALHAQWSIVDPPANALGLVFSTGLAWTVGGG